MPEILVLQLKASNFRSVQRYFDELGFSVETCSVDSFKACPTKTLVLPGVGNFGTVMNHLQESGCADKIREHLVAGGSLIGICLGMHLLFESSDEAPGIPGLSILEGKVRFLGNYIDPEETPQIGWATFDHSDSLETEAYFAHSFFVDCDVDHVAMKRCIGNFCYPSVITHENLLGIQFHPERSRGNADRLVLGAIQGFIHTTNIDSK